MAPVEWAERRTSRGWLQYALEPEELIVSWKDEEPSSSSF